MPIIKRAAPPLAGPQTVKKYPGGFQSFGDKRAGNAPFVKKRKEMQDGKG
jgi:hypothetical protein